MGVHLVYLFGTASEEAEVSARTGAFAALAAALLLTGCASRPVSPANGNSTGATAAVLPSSPPPSTSGSWPQLSASSAAIHPGTISPMPTPRPDNPEPPPQADATVHVDQSFDGATLTLRVGQHLLLVLGGSWTPPRAAILAGTATPPLRTDSSDGYPAPPPATALFTAFSIGTTTITAVTDAACLHTAPRCLMAQRMFAVTVHVLPQRAQ
jgi:hypothetical protein